jgi:2-iminobutanoate/2-iminopropanoate deaminase
MVNHMSDGPAKMHAISSADAPPPGGHYSQAVVHQGLVYVSGQLPVVSGKPHDPSAPFETQVRHALANLSAVLAASGSSLDRVLKLSAYIVGAANWPAFNTIYAQVLGAARPARSVIPVPELHYGYLVEIDAVAMQEKIHE